MHKGLVLQKPTKNEIDSMSYVDYQTYIVNIFHGSTTIDKIYTHYSLIMEKMNIIWLFYFSTYENLWWIKHQSFHNFIPIFMFST